MGARAAHGTSPYAERRHRRIALVGESEHDVREVMIEGRDRHPARLRRAPSGRIWTATRRRLEWPNGAVAQAFSAEDPEQLRGPQFDAAWCDELAKWRHAEATFDMLQFGLRLGVAAAPAHHHDAAADPADQAADRRPAHRGDARGDAGERGVSVACRSSTRSWRAMPARGSGARRSTARSSRTGPTRCGRGDDRGRARGRGAAACAHRGRDRSAGLGAAGRRRLRHRRGRAREDGTVYVLEDATVAGTAPAGWAARAIALYRRLAADTLVAEVNQGGDMVRAVLRQVDPAVPLKTVHATRGKYLRAEPVAALYAQGRVKHVGRPLVELEDQMCDFGLDGLSSGRSPDRLDALVWAVTELTGRGWAGATDQECCSDSSLPSPLRGGSRPSAR